MKFAGLIGNDSEIGQLDRKRLFETDDALAFANKRFQLIGWIFGIVEYNGCQRKWLLDPHTAMAIGAFRIGKKLPRWRIMQID